MPQAVAPGRARRLRAIRARARATPVGRLAWRIGVTIAGVVVIAVGIVLLPLPGPGWLIIFGGLGILATEYEWAARLLRWVREQVRRWTQWLGRQRLWVRLLAGFLTVLLVVAIIAAAWLVPR